MHATSIAPHLKAKDLTRKEVLDRVAQRVTLAEHSLKAIAVSNLEMEQSGAFVKH